MKAKSKADRLSVRLVHMEILLALALLGVVFLTAAHSDTVSARQQMATTIRYIREQCNRYNRIELASETKSLMRVMESVDHIARQMAADGSLANIWIPPRCWTRRFTPKSATPRALPARTGA